jgi:hypothetical protein
MLNLQSCISNVMRGVHVARFIPFIALGVLLICDIGRAQKANEPKAKETLAPLPVVVSGYVQLPQQTVLMSLSQIADVITVQTGISCIVDKRCASRKLLLSTPTTQTAANDLLRVMATTTGLSWRKVDNLLFLTYTSENPQSLGAQKSVQRMVRDSRTVGKFAQDEGLLNGLTSDDLAAGPREWGSLSAAQQNTFANMAANGLVDSDSGALRSLFNDPNRMKRATVEFNIMSRLNIAYGDGSVNMGSFINLHRGGAHH